MPLAWLFERCRPPGLSPRTGEEWFAFNAASHSSFSFYHEKLVRSNVCMNMLVNAFTYITKPNNTQTQRQPKTNMKHAKQLLKGRKHRKTKTLMFLFSSSKEAIIFFNFSKLLFGSLLSLLCNSICNLPISEIFWFNSSCVLFISFNIWNILGGGSRSG